MHAAARRRTTDHPAARSTGACLQAVRRAEAAASAAVFAALLTPGGLRDGGVQEVKLPPGADLVRLDLQLESNDAAGRYGVRMARDRQAFLIQENVPVHREAGLAILSVEVPATALPAGLYSFSVTEGNANNATTFYHFKIR